jgi:hypothetical protein
LVKDAPDLDAHEEVVKLGVSATEESFAKSKGHVNHADYQDEFDALEDRILGLQGTLRFRLLRYLVDPASHTLDESYVELLKKAMSYNQVSLQELVEVLLYLDQKGGQDLSEPLNQVDEVQGVCQQLTHPLSGDKNKKVCLFCEYPQEETVKEKTNAEKYEVKDSKRKKEEVEDSKRKKEAKETKRKDEFKVTKRKGETEPDKEPETAKKALCDVPKNLICDQSLCPKIDGPTVGRHYTIPFDKLRYLPSAVKADADITDFEESGVGLTPGQELKLGQANTADRIDKIWGQITWDARMSFAMNALNFAKDYLVQAWYLYNQAKGTPCEYRDPSEFSTFLRAPAPGPACPQFGAAYFPKWLTWMASPKATIFDDIGEYVEYACATGVLPDPPRRLIQEDDTVGHLRLQYELPSCITAPDVYKCVFRESQFSAQDCPMSVDITSAMPLERDTADTIQFKMMLRKYTPSSVIGLEDLSGFTCTEGSVIGDTPTDTGVDKHGSERCPAKKCVAYSYNQKTNDCRLYDSAPATIHGGPSHEVVCSSASRLQLDIQDNSLQTILEIMVEANSLTIKAVGSGQKTSITLKGFLDTLCWRYIDVRVIGNEIIVTPMIRLNPSEENFNWFRSTDHEARLTDPALANVRFVSLECMVKTEVRDFCVRKGGSTRDEFLYPSVYMVAPENRACEAKVMFPFYFDKNSDVPELQTTELTQMGATAESKGARHAEQGINDMLSAMWDAAWTDSKGTAVPHQPETEEVAFVQHRHGLQDEIKTKDNRGGLDSGNFAGRGPVGSTFIIVMASLGLGFVGFMYFLMKNADVNDNENNMGFGTIFVFLNPFKAFKLGSNTLGWSVGIVLICVALMMIFSFAWGIVMTVFLTRRRTKVQLNARALHIVG